MLLKEGFMKTFRRFLSILTLVAFMSGPALVSAVAQNTAPDAQQYDQPSDTQPVQPDTGTAPPDNQAAPAEPQYDQSPANQEAPPNGQYDAQASASANAANQTSPTDPPARVASLQYMTGSISVQPQGTGDWVAGELNRPLTNSDNVWADKNSRAEISVGTGLIGIGSETSLTLTNISENAVQLQLHQGALYLHVRRLYDGEKYEVDTPNQAFTVEKPGDYRFDVNPDADKTVITVWSGEGQSTGDGPSVDIQANEQVRFSNGTSMTVEKHAAPAPDDFDQWAQARDQKLDNSQSARYVPPDMVGGDDLDQYGVWKETPDYGEIWYPSVAPGWAPYYYGHWIWENPWGWTWVDYEPWGFAPFHYGRWVYWGGGWGWAPGPIFARPFYSPAMVAWFGGGFGVGFGFGPGFGWCPLGWGEPFIPWYGVSRGYFYRVNFTNGRFWGRGGFDLNGFYGRNFVNGRFAARNGFQMHYANMNRPGGFTAVSRNTLVNSLSVAHNNIHLSANQMSHMSAVHSLGVSPTRASIMGSSGARAAVPPSRAFSRPVVSRMAAPSRSGFNSSARAGFNTARPGQGSAARPAIGSANRGSAFSGSRAPATSAMGARSIPRPPNAGNLGPRTMEGSNRMGGMNGRYSPQMSSRNNVPRPPSASMGRGEPSYSPRGASPSYSPRGGASAPHESAPRSSGPRGELSTPRPSSSYMASRGYDSYGRSSQGYYNDSGRSASSYYGDRSASPYGGSYSRPSYGGSAYSRSYGSYGGGRSSAYAGGFGGRSYGNVGGSRSYGGRSYAGRSYAGRSYAGRSYGGGGHVSSGGSHFGGGGHSGGGHSGGGGHGGRR